MHQKSAPCPAEPLISQPSSGQPDKAPGAGERYRWRRCGKKGRTCATGKRRCPFRGAGPHPKTLPAPKTSDTCAICTPSVLHTCAINPIDLHHQPHQPHRPAPPITPPEPSCPENYSSTLAAAPRGFPTIRATVSCSSPKQRASCATEVRNER